MFERFKWVALVLGIVLLSVALLSPLVAKTIDQCYDDYERCRVRAIQSSGGVIATTIQLTACDVGVAACIVVASIS